MSHFKGTLPPVRDQGARYTCLSIALSDGHHAVRMAEPPLSADFLHFHAAIGDRVGVNDAVSKIAAMTALEAIGQPCETECPYSPVKRSKDWKPAAPSGETWRMRTAIASAIAWKAIEDHVSGGRPVVIVLDIDEAFSRPVGGVVAGSAEPVRGSHAVLALTLDPREPRVLVRNSWGDEWGDGGYAWLSSRYVAARCTAVISFEGAVL